MSTGIPRDFYTPLTRGEAHQWARRFRKLGFSPVTVQYDPGGTETFPAGHWYLRCNWPYDFAAMPPDLYAYITLRDEERIEVRRVTTRYDARMLLAQFRAVRAGMGSRPIPDMGIADQERTCAPVARIWSDYDDWPLGSQLHPDYHPGTLTPGSTS